jgi:hypothetical protein
VNGQVCARAAGRFRTVKIPCGLHLHGIPDQTVRMANLTALFEAEFLHLPMMMLVGHDCVSSRHFYLPNLPDAGLEHVLNAAEQN